MELSERIRMASGWDDIADFVDAWADGVAQLEGKIEALENILWKCRHGGKGGVPVDYQDEVDRLLVTHQGEEGQEVTLKELKDTYLPNRDLDELRCGQNE